MWVLLRRLGKILYFSIVRMGDSGMDVRRGMLRCFDGFRVSGYGIGCSMVLILRGVR